VVLAALAYPLVLAFCAFLMQATAAPMFWAGLVVGILTCLVGWAVIAATKERHLVGALLMSGGFAFLLIVGPSLRDLQLRDNGEGKLGVVTAVHHDGGSWECAVELSGGRTVDPATEDEGCGPESREGDRLIVVTDPSGMLEPRVQGPLSTTRLVTSGTLAGLLLVAGIYGGLMAPRPRRA
jgi:hypothetical protein